MARAGPSRSQRATQQPSQSQPRRRRAEHHDDDEGDEQEDVEPEEDEDVDMDANNGLDQLATKANHLVRLALFTEHKRSPLRRDDINKKGPSYSPLPFYHQLNIYIQS
jgi:hypothetical protein